MFTLTISSGLVHLPTFFFYVGSMFKQLILQIYLIVSVIKRQTIPPSQWRAMTIYAVAWARNQEASNSSLFTPHPTSHSPVSRLWSSTISTALAIMSTTFISIKSPDLQPCWGSKSDHINSLLIPYQQLQLGFRKVKTPFKNLYDLGLSLLTKSLWLIHFSNPSIPCFSQAECVSFKMCHNLSSADIHICCFPLPGILFLPLFACNWHLLISFGPQMSFLPGSSKDSQW